MPLPEYHAAETEWKLERFVEDRNADQVLLRYYSVTIARRRTRKRFKPIGRARVYRATDEVLAFVWDEYEEVIV